MRMSRRAFATLAMTLALGLLGAAGCADVTGVDYMKEFTVGTMPDPETLVPGVEANSALRLLYIQGLVQTPSPCYDLAGDFEKKGSTLTLRVEAERDDGTGCEVGKGGFRYNALVGGLKRGSYTLKVVHTIDGAQASQFTLSVEVMQ